MNAKMNPLTEKIALMPMELTTKRILKDVMQKTDADGRFVIATQADLDSVVVYIESLYSSSSNHFQTISKII